MGAGGQVEFGKGGSKPRTLGDIWHLDRVTGETFNQKAWTLTKGVEKVSCLVCHRRRARNALRRQVRHQPYMVDYILSRDGARTKPIHTA